MTFIDTNIIMYAAGKDHRYKTPCLNVIKKILEGQILAVSNVEVLQEILYRYWHIGELNLGLQVFNDFIEIIPNLLEISLSDMERAKDLLKKNPKIKPRDAVHAAVLLNHHIDTIISTDKDFDQIKEITRQDPITLTT